MTRNHTAGKPLFAKLDTIILFSLFFSSLKRLSTFSSHGKYFLYFIILVGLL